jgi:hypothetical protein
MTWTFADAATIGTVAEVSYAKNGAAEVSSAIDGHFPNWTLNTNADTHVSTLASRADVGWFIQFFSNGPRVGEAWYSHHDNVLGSGRCWVLGAPAPAPVSAPAPTVDGGVPIIYAHGALTVNAMISGHSLTMLIDTGANVSSIPTALADRLIAEGRATEREGMNVTLADGSSVHARSLMVNSIVLGNHTVSNVIVTVSDAGSLLSLPVLNAIGRFTIDSANGVLAFN